MKQIGAMPFLSECPLRRRLIEVPLSSDNKRFKNSIQGFPATNSARKGIEWKKLAIAAAMAWGNVVKRISLPLYGRLVIETNSSVLSN